MKIPFRILLLALLALAAPAALAEVYIHLKDGKVIYLPIGREDIDRIEYGDEPGASAEEGPVTLPPESPASLPDAGAFRDTDVRRAAQKAGPQIVKVGPDERFKTPSQAEPYVKSGDTVEIAPGVYENDFVKWEQNNITLKGVGGRPHLKATDYVYNDKGIWIVSGDNVVIDNIEFSGARVDDENGAGIRAQGKRLTIRNSYFHDNQMGILSYNESGGTEIVIEDSEFDNNLEADPASHSIYIGWIDKFRLTGSYVHRTRIGHHVKTRAIDNYIAYNRLTDEAGGDASYAIDVSNCGRAIIIGNVIHKSAQAENRTAINWGSSECPIERGREIYIVNNTFVNEEMFATFFTNHRPEPAILRNNLIVGVARLADGAAVDENNIVVLRAKFRDRANYDLHLVADSDGVDKGVNPGATKDGQSLKPERQYRFRTGTEARPSRGPIDVGAFEYTGR